MVLSYLPVSSVHLGGAAMRHLQKHQFSQQVEHECSLTHSQQHIVCLIAQTKKETTWFCNSAECQTRNSKPRCGQRGACLASIKNEETQFGHAEFSSCFQEICKSNITYPNGKEKMPHAATATSFSKKLNKP